MAGLVPAIHVLTIDGKKDVDARDKRGHDGWGKAMSLKLYELVGADESRPFSPFCWRTRMALAHKGLSAETIPWCFTEKEAIAPHQSDKVPVLLDGETSVVDPGQLPIISKIPIPTGRRCSAARAAGPWRGC